MLTEIHIRDFALIDRLDLSLGGGFSVLTGETGAGKSIIIDAISAALGGASRPTWFGQGRASDC
jgi:DNA repair protein RecN (Recombination protein N)